MCDSNAINEQNLHQLNGDFIACYLFSYMFHIFPVIRKSFSTVDSVIFLMKHFTIVMFAFFTKYT